MDGERRVGWLMCVSYRYPAQSTYLGGDPKALGSWECR